MYDEKCLTRIGGNIRFLRTACQLNQQEMAKRIGISQTHLSNLEHNHAQISLKLLLRIANVLECRCQFFWILRRRWIGAKNRLKKLRLSRKKLQKPIP